MSTRGLVLVKFNGTTKRYWNHYDSYPRALADRLYTLLTVDQPIVPAPWNVEWTDSPDAEVELFDFSKLLEPNHPQIDYLFHEYVYVVDLDAKTLTCYASVWDGDPKGDADDRSGHLQKVESVDLTKGPKPDFEEWQRKANWLENER